MVLDKSKWTTMSIEHDAKDMLDNFHPVIQWVPVRSASDKIRYLLNYFDMHSKK